MTEKRPANGAVGGECEILQKLSTLPADIQTVPAEAVTAVYYSSSIASRDRRRHVVTSGFGAVGRLAYSHVQ